MSKPSPISATQRKALEQATGYKFRSLKLLVQALTHRSWRNERIQRGEAEGLETNERLEFLGDAVLDLAITAELLSVFPEKPEGELSKLRAALVQEKSLAQVAKELGLQDYILLGEAEDRAGGRRKPSILADAYEALLGAIYLDSGMRRASAVIQEHFGKRLTAPSLARRVTDHKTRLQERTQQLWKKAPHYRTATVTGPDHRRIFEVEVVINGEVIGAGQAGSKKEAGQKAARMGLKTLKERAAE